MAEDRKKTLRFKSLSTVFARLLEYCRNKRRRAAKTTLLHSFICRCMIFCYIRRLPAEDFPEIVLFRVCHEGFGGLVVLFRDIVGNILVIVLGCA